MDMDMVLVLIITVIAHCTVAYGALYALARKYQRKFDEALKPENMIARITTWLNYRKPLEPGQEGENPTMLEALCSYLGASLGRYISGMFGRASRDVNNAALESIGEQVPVVGALLKIPGFRKMMKNPVVAQFIGPAIEGVMKKNLGGGEGAGGPPA